MITHRGGCHCGRVRYEVRATADIDVTRCNCSICSMTGHLHLFVPRADFQLTQGQDDLQTYTFNTGVAQHYFCRHCGVKSFYIPRSHPDGVSVNARCLDPGTVTEQRISDFDGANWEKNIHELSPISD
jgi:hypothetical protein